MSHLPNNSAASEHARLGAVFNDQRIRGDAARMAAAFDLACREPGLSSAAIIARVTGAGASTGRDKGAAIAARFSAVTGHGAQSRGA